VRPHSHGTAKDNSEKLDVTRLAKKTYSLEGYQLRTQGI